MSNKHLEIFDLAQYPAFTRNSVGFDDVIRRMKHIDRWANSAGSTNSYPPYNIESIDNSNYIVTLAVAGFAKEELIIETREGELIISGTKPETDQAEPVYLYKGIATRDFNLKFKLEDFVEVIEAKIDAGLLVIKLERKLPEALKPKTITIK